jgi:RNA polymerase-binding transcription factor DksA
VSKVQSENIKPESNLVSQTELSRARTSKNNKAAQATRSSDELKTQVRFRKSKKISKLIKRIESEMSQIQSQMTRIEKDLGGILRLMQDKGSK